MVDSIKSLLANSGVLGHVVLPPDIELILSALETDGAINDLGSGIRTGQVKLTSDLSKSPLPGLDFSLGVPTGIVKPAPFKLKLEPEVNPTSFKFWLVLSKQGQTFFVFRFLDTLPALALTGASLVNNPDSTVSLAPLPDSDSRKKPALVSRSDEAGSDLAPSLLIQGSGAAPASMRFTPDTDSTEGIVAFGIEPDTVVFGTSGIGFKLPALVIDDSETAKAPGSGAPDLDPPIAALPADENSWRGIIARELDFYLPADVPLFGGRAIKGYFAFAFGASGAELVVESKVPAQPQTAGQPGHLGYSIRIECRDPTAKGLSGLVPTLITATMELPLDGSQGTFNDGSNKSLGFAAGKPVIVATTFSRNPVNKEDVFRIAIGVAAQGEEGIISVTSTQPGGAKIFNTTAALATALIADKDVARNADVGNTKGVVLYGLLAAGSVLSSLFSDDSKFVLHGVEVEASGHGSPLGGPIVLSLDYSVAIRVTKVDIGVLSVSMSPDQPMRIRMRSARLSVDPTKNGLAMIGLDFDRATMEIENPGAWNVEGLEQLFDVLGSRSGRGSSWVEVDLRFKLNLGPISVSGATIRATLNDNGSIDASIRGLSAGITIPGAIEGTGGVQLRKNGFAANLSAKVVALNVAADASVIYAPPMILLQLGVDLPAPIPLANSGFGLFGIGGLFGIAAVPNYGDDPDPVRRQLQWTPNGPDSFRTQDGQFSFGLSGVVGTLPDFGFSFSAKAGILVTAPDIAVRGALNGRVLQPAVKISDPSYPPTAGVSFLGFVGVDSEALSFGVLGQVDLRPLLLVQVPLAGHFPFKPDISDWYLYLGADGYPGGAPNQGRGIGPMSAVVLPDILNVSADAYVMMRGKGIEAWPYQRPLPSGPITKSGGFIVAFGFALQNEFGPKPIAWAELYASVDILVGSKPPTLAGFGRAGGSLNLGPFSLGVQAQVAFILAQEQKYFWAEVTGKIELLFFDIEGTVTISFGQEPTLSLPDPDRHPLDLLDANGNRVGSLGSLTDDTYRVTAKLVESPSLITDDMFVWPDAIISLPFAISPKVAATASTQFPMIAGPGALPAAPATGNDMLSYVWALDRVELFDVTNEVDPFTGTSTKAGSQLAARWQTPRATTAPGADVDELVLFSTSADLWVNRVADPGKLPDDPLQSAADICRRSVSPKRGWAVGYLAAQLPRGFRLPPDPIGLSVLDSRVEATMKHFGVTTAGEEIPVDRPSFLPPPYSVAPAELVTWPSAMKIERGFIGHLVTPILSWLPGADPSQIPNSRSSLLYVGQRIDLILLEGIFDGEIILVADRKLFSLDVRRLALRVVDDGGLVWPLKETVQLPTGETAGLFKAPSAQLASMVSVVWPLGEKLGVIGLSGMTKAAMQAAAAENAAFAAATAAAASAMAAGPKTDPTGNTSYQRVILEPGKLYRLDIDMRWSGELYKQDQTGNRILAASKADQTTYSPKGGVPPPSKRQLFFKTTPKPPPGAGKVSYGDARFTEWLYIKQNNFQPEMVQRYLAGYQPGQSEDFRFCDDALRAHFSQDHVVALAKAYGFDLKVAIRRVDRPGPSYALPKLLTPIWSFALDKSFLNDTDARRLKYAVESACSVPKPGTTGTVLEPLEPEALYELYVFAKANDAGVADGRLPGVTFRTSRWRGSADMLAGLGFTVGGHVTQPVMMGDLHVDVTSFDVARTEIGDPALQAALLQLGLDGWPVATTPRVSRLWTLQAPDAWLFAGLMVESPEPIHRPGRLELQGLTLSMGHTGSGVKFDVQLRDRSGSRIIYLTSNPFGVVTREFVGGPSHPGPLGHPGLMIVPVKPSLAIGLNDLTASAAVNGTLALPSLPVFAGEP
jgi:hypothetical protein